MASCASLAAGDLLIVLAEDELLLDDDELDELELELDEDELLLELELELFPFKKLFSASPSTCIRLPVICVPPWPSVNVVVLPFTVAVAVRVVAHQLTVPPAPSTASRRPTGVSPHGSTKLVGELSTYVYRFMLWGLKTLPRTGSGALKRIVSGSYILKCAKYMPST